MPPSVGLVLVSSNVILEPFDGSLSQKSYNNVRIKLFMVDFHCKKVYFSEKSPLYHFLTLVSFHLYAVSVYIHIIFHMHLLAYETAHFCVFLACVFYRVILYSFRRCAIAPLSV